MGDAFSIIIPAYRAQHTIARAAASVIAQSYASWELIIVADDAVDYQQILGRQAIADPRIRYLSTGATGSGSPLARNIGLDAAQNKFVTGLDADDFMHHQKLEMIGTALQSHGVVSCALQVVSEQLTPLRTVGEGPDRQLMAQAYKFTNISMDSMLAHDRDKADPRFDSNFDHFSDLDFLLKLFANNQSCFHLGQPLHSYVKQSQSISNAPGASDRLILTKKRLLDLLANGHYPLADPNGVAGMVRFFTASLAAEQTYEAKLAAQPTLLFEDHLEPYLSAVPQMG